MRVSFFWYNSPDYNSYRWGVRGIAFHRKGSQINVHYRNLVFGTGYSFRARLINFVRAWKTLLTLGYRY